LLKSLFPHTGRARILGLTGPPGAGKGTQAEFVAAHHRLANTPMTNTADPEDITDDWMHAHNAFHVATMCGCGSPRLIEIAANLGGSAAMYRHVSQRYDHDQRDVAGEHRAIFEATVARDADLACRLHGEHIARTADIVTRALAEQELAAHEPDQKSASA